MPPPSPNAKGSGTPGEVVSYDTVANSQRAEGIEDAATRTATGGEPIESRGVVFDGAVRQRQCCGTAIVSKLLSTPPPPSA